MQIVDDDDATSDQFSMSVVGKPMNNLAPIVFISRIFYGTFVSARYICSGHFWTRSEPFVRHEDNVVIDVCGESKSVFTR